MTTPKEESKERLISALRSSFPEAIQIEFCRNYLRHLLGSDRAIITHILRWHWFMFRYKVLYPLPFYKREEKAFVRKEIKKALLEQEEEKE